MSSNPLTLAEFRTEFTAFRANKYPDSVVNFRLALADVFFGESVWRNPVVRKHAMGLYVAHFLSVGGKDACGAYSGDGSGALGVVSSKSVDGASVSYDTGSSSETGAGFWNATAFGRELWQLMQVYGAGAIQL